MHRGYDYSQNGEQAVILKYFSKMKLAGRLLSIGENDGQTLSNTRALMLRGNCHGVFYEPAPRAFEKLRKLYEGNPRAVCHNLAVADYNDTAELYDCGEHLGKGDTSLLSTLDEEETRRWTNERFEKVQVRVVDAAEIKGPFDFVTIDAEGWDLRILRRLDLSGVSMICVEFNGKDKQMFDHIARWHGLKLLTQNSENLIYAK